jgi:iron complex outermembrane receptor protein
MPDLSILLKIGYYQKKTTIHETIDKELPVYLFGTGLDEMSIQNNRYNYSNIALKYYKQIPAIKSKLMINLGYTYHKINEENAHVLHSIASDSSESSSFSSRKGFFLNFNYALKERYIFQISILKGSWLYIGSQALNPTFSIGWNIKKERILVNFNPISKLQINYYYTKTGALSPPFNRTYFTDELILSQHLNLGIGFLKNRLTGSIEVYKKEGKDIIKKVNIPDGSNFNNYIYHNVGYIENKGIRFMVNTLLIDKPKFDWNLSFTGNFNTNIIHSLDGFEIHEGQIGLNYYMIQKEGYPENAFYLLQQVYILEGLPIENLYVDQNNDGSRDDEDLYVIKKQAPDFIGGIHSKLVFRNWEIALSGRLSLGNYVYNYPNTFGVSNNIHLNHWYLSNIPVSYNDTQFEYSQTHSDIYLENASFFKADYISVGHRFDDLLKGKLDLQISAVVNHAFTITRYTGQDPEIYNGIENFSYPRTRTFTLQFDLRL